MKTQHITSPILALALIGGASSAMALEIDSSQSSVSLVSTKVLADGASSVAELFTFSSLAGNISDDGSATVTIDLESLETGIDIRDERMSEFFFETASYPTATITAAFDKSVLAAGSRSFDLSINVDLHGSQKLYIVPVLVSADDTTVKVVSEKPILVDAASFDLQGGLGKLGELAGLLHIPTTIPVTFSLSLTR